MLKVARTTNYVCVDVETIGWAPGVHPMIQLAAIVVADDPQFTILHGHSFDACLQVPFGTRLDSSTEAWWTDDRDRLATYVQICKRAVNPHKVASDFAEWLDAIESPTFVGWPVGFDFGFVQNLMGREDFLERWRDHTTVDIKSLSYALLGRDDDLRTKMAALIGPAPTTHNAFQDTVWQARCFQLLMRAAERQSTQNLQRLLLGTQ